MSKTAAVAVTCFLWLLRRFVMSSLLDALKDGVLAARRRPENCQRVPGGKKLRYVARIWVAGVTQEPPRRTICEDMNLPLYSPSAPGSGR